MRREFCVTGGQGAIQKNVMPVIGQQIRTQDECEVTARTMQEMRIADEYEVNLLTTELWVRKTPGR